MPVDTAIQLFAALIALIAIAVALFPGFFQRLVAGEFVQIHPKNLRGTIPRTRDDEPVVYFHLKAVSKCPYIPVHNCRVMLTRVLKQDDGCSTIFDVGLHVPLQLVWAPANSDNERTLVREEVFDFLCMNKPKGQSPARLAPVLYCYLTDVDLTVGPRQTVYYDLIVVGNEFASKKPQRWRVHWDGVWTEKPSEVAQHVNVREARKGEGDPAEARPGP